MIFEVLLLAAKFYDLNLVLAMVTMKQNDSCKRLMITYSATPN